MTNRFRLTMTASIDNPNMGFEEFKTLVQEILKAAGIEATNMAGVRYLDD